MANNRLIVQSGLTAGAIGGTYDIFGKNAGAETVLVFDQTIAYFQGDFARGGDTIKLSDVATDFTIRIAGSNAELTSASDSIVAVIPIGVVGATIQFETAPGVYGDSRTLVFDGTNVVLGTQVITGTAAAVAPAAPPAPAAFAAGPAIESAASDEQAAAKAALAALDVPAAPAIPSADDAHAAAAAASAQIDASFFAHSAAGGGLANFIVNFA
ncbi:hypothetical protein [Sphingomonas colocasiae]|uniref:FecR protein domain-containing protein n=1 Tax=Sphingomonas colocasiae TaxID=1848973 RepID=A0ABS7PTB3_9SPHN|nr:hypothetical protein [Sphingomonas colocasiae]MBY8824496.1 hypothetical protein [Sphingomonas colocasiae]